MEIEERLTTMEKRLRYHQVVAGILAFCLILAVATHLDAQPRQRGSNQAASQPIDARRLNQITSQILNGIEQRLTALEKAGISHRQPTAPARPQTGSSSDLTAIEARLTALENQADSQQPAAANQAGSSPGELTCTKLTVVNSAGQPLIALYEAINGAGEVRLNEANGRMIIQMGSEIGGTYLRLDRGGQSAISFMGNAGSAMSSRAFFYNGNTGFMDEIYQPN